jgi:hypothetical protein
MRIFSHIGFRKSSLCLRMWLILLKRPLWVLDGFNVSLLSLLFSKKGWSKVDVSVMIISTCRLISLFNRTKDASLSKYTRQYVLDLYDGLHKYTDFYKVLKPDDFPLLEFPWLSRRVTRHVINPVDDSENNLGDDFYKDWESFDRAGLEL